MTISTETSTDTCRGRIRRRRTRVMAGAVVVGLVVVLWFTGILPGALDAISARRQGALLGVVDVFKCCILTWKALTVMLPAFLLAGAIAAFVPTALVLKYLGARAHKGRAYAVAAGSGIILALCSCNIVPLFVSIYRRGAGLGPAFTFLYAGPAINVVAILFTVQVIGWQIGLWRAAGVPLIALATGMTMAAMFRREQRDPDLPDRQAEMDTGGAVTMGRVWALLALLLALVVYGAWEMGLAARAGGMTLIAAATLGLLAARFERGEVAQWLGETWGLLKLVIPVLLPAVLIIGLLAAYVDVKLVYRLVGPVPGDSGLWAWLKPILLADLFGALMYFPILSEVAFTKTFLLLGMDIGPAMAVLLTGAGLSLPGLIIVSRVIGWRKTLTYQAVVILLTTAFAALFASEVGRYVCACLMMD